GTVERDRRDLALLRARGASRRSLLGLAAAESAALGLIAGVPGAGLALLAVRLAGTGGGAGGARVGVTFAICIGLAFAGALAARVGSSLTAFRASNSEGQRSGGRTG